MIVLLAVSAVACKKTDNKPTEDAPAVPVTIGGRTYPTVKIGTQTWTTVNYDGPGGVPYDAQNTKPAYGKYYTNAEMKAIVAPTGWHVPTMDDFRKLAATAGIQFNVNTDNTEAIRKLTAKTGWLNVQGTNVLGFNAHPAGYIVNNEPPLGGENAEFWTADDRTCSLMEGGNKTSMLIRFYAYTTVETDRFNIRFVKN
jgi:uncharacterized protein (TIGR02145 family)